MFVVVGVSALGQSVSRTLSICMLYLFCICDKIIADELKCIIYKFTIFDNLGRLPVFIGL